ncbi:lysine--tRNA ligase [Methylohalobius crimeensis]|uniref:lysine--tRNA ligase n=1 Tax=Methylohalobius crimeensis TaxID=244365 RepID=UPI0003B62501|nr:lysine--tRNA ligase [Methylohalobius crimeensis]
MTDKSTQDLTAQRRAKLAALREAGIAYPTDFRRDSVAAELHARYGEEAPELFDQTPLRVRVAGRMMTRRIMGKASFCHLRDYSGQMQLYVTRDGLPEGLYREFKKWDIGDIVGAEGVLFKTKTGELSVKVDEIRLLAKCLRPLPEKYHGLTDQEMRYRQRYLDLIMNEVTRRTFQIRSQLVQEMRRFLIERDFLEVETPMMQVIPGGAAARPFVTYHNTLDMQLYLRIAPELYLKRLVAGGFERVFEINRNFRNEGLSTQHNPEFTMLEFYQAYAEYKDLMDLTEVMFRDLAETVLGSERIVYQDQEIDFGKSFQRFTLLESLIRFNPGLASEDVDNLESARRVAEKLEIPILPGFGLGKIQTEIFEKTVEPKLLDPTFITEYPVEVSPLARRNDKNPEVTDRFELFIAGREIANGFTELNDPEEQAERFRSQLEARAAGDEEAMHFDEDYITALEHGMPPTAGEGIGIDRLVMLFANAPSIRDVLLFPHMRPKASSPSSDQTE